MAFVCVKGPKTQWAGVLKGCAVGRGWMGGALGVCTHRGSGLLLVQPRVERSHIRERHRRHCRPPRPRAWG